MWRAANGPCEWWSMRSLPSWAKRHAPRHLQATCFRASLNICEDGLKQGQLPGVHFSVSCTRRKYVCSLRSGYHLSSSRHFAMRVVKEREAWGAGLQRYAAVSTPNERDIMPCLEVPTMSSPSDCLVPAILKKLFKSLSDADLICTNPAFLLLRPNKELASTSIRVDGSRRHS